MRLHLLRLGLMRGLDAPIPGYLVRTPDGEHVLIDTGYPAGGSPDGRIAVDAEHELLGVLDRLGVRPADIRHVVCTHLDPDHSGNHHAFPDAEFIVQRSHYQLALSGSVPRLEQSRKQWDLPGLRYRQVDGDTELLPGIELIESSGHIRGHQSVLVRTAESGPVLLAGDAIPMAAALDPDTRPVLPFDLDEPELRRSTRKLREIAEREGALIVHGHDGPQWEHLRTAPDHY